MTMHQIRMRAILAAAVVSMSAPAMAATQQAAACSLLTASDIEVALGAKASAPVPSEMAMSTAPNSPTAHNCMWSVAAIQGGLTLGMMTPLPPDGSVPALFKHNPGIDLLKAKHWTEEKKEFGSNAWCSIMTPPASDKAPIMSSCSAGVKGVLLSVTLLSPAKKLSIDQAKALLDKAIGRLR
ncbi:MAG: hypothetical protein ABJD07_13765 [Gemmatimonadaceae bacterium]